MVAEAIVLVPNADALETGLAPLAALLTSMVRYLAKILQARVQIPAQPSRFPYLVTVEVTYRIFSALLRNQAARSTALLTLACGAVSEQLPKRASAVYFAPFD